MGGMFGAIGVLAALRERETTGRGQEIQSALFENCVFLSSQHMQQFSMTGEPPPPMPSRVSAWSVYDVFTLADDEQLFIGAVSDKQFLTLCRVIEAPELANDPGLSDNAKRVAVRPQLLKRLGEVLRHHRIEALSPKLEAAGIPYAPIVRPEQLVDDPHLKASGGLVPMQTDDGGTTDVVLLPLTLGGRRPGVRQPLPRVGEHTDEILARLAAERAA
jgi:crotonobetainyl-CoA:carnitine CoA-transferase CaiB-like acyl-CoA transferase